MLLANKETDPMWQGLKALWKLWTIDKPAMLGDWLWDVLVVQFAAFLDRLTLRHVVAFIPVVLLIIAYSHGIPIPPELMLVGDITAYLDIFSLLLLLIGVLARASTIVFAIKQATGRAVRLINVLRSGQRRGDTRHRRTNARRRSIKGGNSDDDRRPTICSAAWA